MKKTYRIKGLDCAACAEKLERSLCRIKGVESASINFVTEKLAVEVAEDGKALSELLKKARRFEDGLELTEEA